MRDIHQLSDHPSLSVGCGAWGPGSRRNLAIIDKYLSYPKYSTRRDGSRLGDLKIDFLDHDQIAVFERPGCLGCERNPLGGRCFVGS